MEASGSRKWDPGVDNIGSPYCESAESVSALVLILSDGLVGLWAKPMKINLAE